MSPPGPQGSEAPHNIAAAILLYFVLNIAVSIPYVMWQRRRLQPVGA